MVDRKEITTKYKIINKLVDDAPFSHVSYYSISFLTSDNIRNAKMLGVDGLKIYNGYISKEIANDDTKAMITKNDKHNIFIGQIGKIYSWDDLNSCEKTIYDDKKLNKMEEKNRENMDKLEIIRQHYEKSNKSKTINIESKRLSSVRDRLRHKLHSRGKISRQELEKNNNNIDNNKKNDTDLEKMDQEIEAAFLNDYLDIEEEKPFKYALITIYSPSKMKGLDSTYFKVRGIFESENQLNERLKYLIENFPDDEIYKINLGLWTAVPKIDFETSRDVEKRLNYLMKAHIDNIEYERQEFEERKKRECEKNREHGQATKTEHKKKKRQKKKKTPTKTSIYQDYTEQDKESIDKIYEYLYEPEIEDKYDLGISQEIKIDNKN